MGYLDNSSITVVAILTIRGPELLSRNAGSFQITHFAIADDEIDYSLFNESHPNGTQYSAEAIENMPLIEAMPTGPNCMNSKLITLTRGANAIPYIVHNYGTAGISLSQGSQETITPKTYNLNGSNVQGAEEYIFTILDSRLRQSFTATGGTSMASMSDIGEFTTIAHSESVRGTALVIQGTTSNALFSSSVTSRATSIIIEGVTSGAVITIPITINSTSS